MNEVEYSVVIPAYNEEDRLSEPLRNALVDFRRRNESAEVIVVDDGSTDATSDMVRELETDFPELRLIRLPDNRLRKDCLAQ